MENQKCTKSNTQLEKDGAINSGVREQAPEHHPNPTTGEPQTFGRRFPDRELPRCPKTREPIPDIEFENTWHSQLGMRQGTSEKYPKAREFGPDNKAIREIEFTNHRRSDHPNPHQHRYIPNKTGGTAKRGPTEPLDNSLQVPQSVQEFLNKSVLNSFKPGGNKK